MWKIGDFPPKNVDRGFATLKLQVAFDIFPPERKKWIKFTPSLCYCIFLYLLLEILTTVILFAAPPTIAPSLPTLSPKPPPLILSGPRA